MKYLVQTYKNIEEKAGFVESLKLPYHVREVKGIYPYVNIPDIDVSHVYLHGYLSVSSLNGNVNIVTDLPVYFEPKRKVKYRHLFYPFNFENQFNTYLRFKFIKGGYLDNYLTVQGASHAHLVIIIAYE